MWQVFKEAHEQLEFINSYLLHLGGAGKQVPRTTLCVEEAEVSGLPLVLFSHEHSEFPSLDYILGLHSDKEVFRTTVGWDSQTGWSGFVANCIRQCVNLRLITAEEKAQSVGCLPGGSEFDLQDPCKNARYGDMCLRFWGWGTDVGGFWGDCWPARLATSVSHSAKNQGGEAVEEHIWMSPSGLLLYPPRGVSSSSWELYELHPRSWGQEEVYQDRSIFN